MILYLDTRSRSSFTKWKHETEQVFRLTSYVNGAVKYPPAKPGAYIVNASEAPDKTVDRAKVTSVCSSPVKGEVGRGMGFACCAVRVVHANPIPSP